MKFKKDGNVFEDIWAALEKFRCPGPCNPDCPLCIPAYTYGKASGHPICGRYVVDHPAEAARLLGYEVAEEDEKPIRTSLMKLNEAIEHLKDIIPKKDWSCEECKQEHEQLLTWLIELEERRKQDQKEASMDKQKPRICEVLGVEPRELFRIQSVHKMWYVTPENGRVVDDRCQHMTGDWLSYAINHPDRIIHQPRFTEEEVADARAIERLFGGFQVGIERDEHKNLWTIPKDGFPRVGIRNTCFPSICPGTSVVLSEIVGGAE